MRSRFFGFSLIELLAVLAILAVLIGAVVPSLASLLEGANIGRGAQMIESQILMARQLASSRGQPVEVRFIKTGNSSDGGLGGIQLWQLEPSTGANNAGTPIPVSRVETLPSGIRISEDASVCSRLLVSSPATNIMPAGGPYSGSAYAAVKIHPSGLVSPTTSMSDLFLSVVSARHSKSETPPSNFATVQINPMTGTTSTYRP